MSVAIFKYYGIGMSRVMWDARTLPAVRQVFTALFSNAAAMRRRMDAATDGLFAPSFAPSSSSSLAGAAPAQMDLVTSFDGLSVRRGAEHKVALGKTAKGWDECGWVHVDRNLAHTSDPCGSFQATLNALDVDPATTGAFLVVPGSHRTYYELVRRRDPEMMAWLASKKKDHYLPMDAANPVVRRHLDASGKLVCRAVACDAGDLVVWASNVVHANAPALKPPTGRLTRLAIFVSMMPRERAQDELVGDSDELLVKGKRRPKRLSPEEFLEQRFAAAARGFTAGHSPHRPGENNHLLYPRAGCEIVTPPECFRAKDSFSAAELALL